MTLWRALNALNVVHTLPKMLEYPAICSRHQTIKDVIVHFAPSMKWNKTISHNVRQQTLSLIFSNFVQYTVIQWFHRC